jgi:hypothetical protein
MTPGISSASVRSERFVRRAPVLAERRTISKTRQTIGDHAAVVEAARTIRAALAFWEHLG